jgi:hypothetical protein
MMGGSGSAQIMDPDPGGQRTYGSYGSGSTTLLCKIISEIKYLRPSHNQTKPIERCRSQNKKFRNDHLLRKNHSRKSRFFVPEPETTYPCKYPVTTASYKIFILTYVSTKPSSNFKEKTEKSCCFS